ncbi:acyl-CoA dehydrogenase [Corynebacterium sp. 320]|uniref:acyl-CoA dehydrogenase family protein n=1 Tax=Corynebacterium TaxID=1716 RepID=UPI00125CCE08|nr:MULTISPECIES: acyl-CoA dehydrogenase family protein [Corynebacterium]KAB1504463.1 acyl-CoA dehydrogenase [Corynebacterium sp. 320]KAB1552439.1 acyl-CoA dehydrogenase [Corynebacterium sp. 321]KAB1554347.1 acyl-CoA dehydrogenase [Corynebacterium sp. 319]KAB3528599.1 acyl-CoA dehydrogenase [Corynebacterium sp. 250]KAB3539910.1 acyl-CoA dehydrogenase [Corynebacterium sp. 366]
MDRLTEDLLRSTVDTVVSKYGRHYRRAKIAADEPATELWKDLADAGLVGIGLPEEYGGGGAGLLEFSIVAERLAEQGHLPVLLVMSPGIVGSILLGVGTHDQKKRFLPGIASGTVKCAFAITEPEAGSNTHRTRTKLQKTDDGTYRLHGEKCFISGVDEADYVLVVAREVDEANDGQVCCCLVPTDTAGLTKAKIETEDFSADSQWLVHCDNVRVEARDVVGRGTNGFKALFKGLNPERILMAAFCNGIALRALSKAIDYSKSREVWGAPIGSHQGVAHPLAEAKIDVELARHMTARAASAADAGEHAGELANYAKFSAARAAEKAVDRAIQTHGGNGFSKDYEVSELYWPARLFRTAPVSEEMILNYVSHQVLGLPRSY